MTALLSLSFFSSSVVFMCFPFALSTMPIKSVYCLSKLEVPGCNCYVFSNDPCSWRCMIFLPAQYTCPLYMFFFRHLDISIDKGLLLNKSLVMCFLANDFLSGIVGALCNTEVPISYRFCNTTSLFAY